MLDVVLQLRATGTSSLIAVIVVAISVLTIIMSVAIAVVLLRDYRREPGHMGQLKLAVGLLLLASVPELLRIALPTMTSVGVVGRSILVSGCELSGLGIILRTIFGGDS
ncbi:hypothetical protein [Natrinema hispanicum]|uniref:Uncharacterized protein n=1 Tax=Natrinema hispanicum TaxID=392421 RepID=A0A1I0J2T3_9EURY|nr:hypothetical protein [Natrinema hispanicum]RZV06470.1 hypothetical protein BDK88_3474 [Natrinema hispanicum]SDD88469.1 hypothetical protein SAMN05192552_106410 [Natrinema hispanicum]SEU03348.1 hypothetical protein SAMN04488694_12931 [Natrinema hispanicum]